MAMLQTAPKLGILAPDFLLAATDGKTYALADISRANQWSPSSAAVALCGEAVVISGWSPMRRRWRPRGSPSWRSRQTDDCRYSNSFANI